MTQLLPTDNVVYVSGKPTLVYVKAISVQFLKQNAQTVTLLSRGRNNSKTLDVLQISLDVFLKDKVVVKNMSTKSEFTNIDGKNIRMTVLNITLEKVN